MNSEDRAVVWMIAIVMSPIIFIVLGAVADSVWGCGS